MSESSDFESDKAKISINKFEAPMMLAYLKHKVIYSGKI